MRFILSLLSRSFQLYPNGVSVAAGRAFFDHEFAHMTGGKMAD